MISYQWLVPIAIAAHSIGVAAESKSINPAPHPYIPTDDPALAAGTEAVEATTSISSSQAALDVLNILDASPALAARTEAAEPATSSAPADGDEDCKCPADDCQFSAVEITRFGKQFSIPIQVGTPPQDLNVLLDMGASQMWLINDKCTSETGRQLFSTASTSYTSAELPAESASNTLDYGGRVQIKGDWSSEKFTVGNVSLEKQTFLSVNEVAKMSPSLAKELSGLMGFSRPSDKNLVTASFWSDLPEGSQMVGVHLPRSDDKSGKGQLALGGANPSCIDGGDVQKITWVETVDPVKWMVKMDNLVVGDKPALPNGAKVFIDSAASSITAPEGDVKSMYDIIAPEKWSMKNTRASLPCDTKETTISFKFGSGTFDLPFADFLVKDPDGTCYGVISPRADSKDYWRVGSVFLQNIYTIYSMADDKVGFAPLAQNNPCQGSLVPGSATGVNLAASPEDGNKTSSTSAANRQMPGLPTTLSWIATAATVLLSWA